MGAKPRTRGGNRRTVLASALMVTAALASALAATPAWAQQAAASTPAIAQLQSERSFDIPAQPLTDALVAFGQQSGIQVTVDGTIARNVSSPAVRGTMTTEQALRRLLAGSGLTYTMSGSTVAIEKPGQRSGDGATMLGPITVHADRVPSRAEIGNLPPPYAGGQVATGGKLGLLGNRDFMDTPFNQTSYTSKLIQDQQARALADVVENDPSVFVATRGAAQGAESFNIRGYAFNNADVAFNGLYGIAPTSNSYMTMEPIERVEILKGPSALLSGIAPNQSVGGGINLVPKRAGEKPLIEFMPSYASDGQLGGHVDVGRRFGQDNSFGVRVNGVYRNGDTAIDRQSQETQLLTAGVDYQGESIRLSGDFGYQFLRTDVTRRQVLLGAGVAVPDPPENSSNWHQAWEFYENENPFGMVRGEVDIAESITAYLAAGAAARYGLLRNRSSFLSDAQGTLTGNGIATSIREETYTVEGGVRASFDTGFVRHAANVAYSFLSKETGVLSASFTGLPNSNLYNPVFVADPGLGGLPDPKDAPKDTQQKNSSLALADTLSILNETVQLTVGVRRQEVGSDRFNRITGVRTSSYNENAVTPAVGLIVKPVEHVSLYGNYIEGLQQGAVAPQTAANAGEIFPPAKTEQYEVGAKFDFGTVATTISAFQIAQPGSFTDPTTNVFSSGGEQRNRGLELAVFGEPIEGIRVIGGIAYIDAELTKTQGGVNQGKDAPGVPPYRATLSVEWDAPFVPGLTLSGRAIYTSSAYLNQANTLKVQPYTIVDLGARLSVDAYGIPIVVRANVLNVLDENYWVSLNGPLSLGSPRTFLLSASFNL